RNGSGFLDRDADERRADPGVSLELVLPVPRVHSRSASRPPVLLHRSGRVGSRRLHIAGARVPVPAGTPGTDGMIAAIAAPPALEAWRGESIRADLASLAGASVLRAGLAVSALVWILRLATGANV